MMQHKTENWASKESGVAVTRIKTYDDEAVYTAVKRHFTLLGLGEKLKPGMKVLLKPNLLMKRRPADATTTHPALVGGIARCLCELGITDITLADSPGGPYTKYALGGIYEMSGMRAMAEKYGIRLNWDFGSFERKCEKGAAVRSFTLINPVKDADFIIDIAKLKTHAMTTLSGAVKNLFGTVPGLMKPEFHLRFPDRAVFANMLLDLCETVRPNLTFVDAIVSMEGDGPSGGTPKETGMILSGENPYHLDMLLCKIANLPLDSVETVKQAASRGLAPKNVGEIPMLGDTPEYFSDYQKPKSSDINFYNHIPRVFRGIVKPLITKRLVSRPVIVKRGCIGCGKCKESCPADTIQMQNKKAVIDYKKCIKCFCCHEMCPVKTIKIKRFKLFRAL